MRSLHRTGQLSAFDDGVREPSGAALRLGARSHTTDIVVGDRLLAPSPVFTSYWTFAERRQRLYMDRVLDPTARASDDPILARHRFTNAFRASDRVSQYLIKRVIYAPGAPVEPRDVFFRILLFKIFNKISTWETLERAVGPITWASYDSALYSRVLESACAEGPIYSAAYLMPPPRLGFARKHENHLRLIELMIKSELDETIVAARSMEQVYKAVRSFPSIGPFLAYQFTIDLNYSRLINFSEDEFVVAGPGAKDGIRKCFGAAAEGIEAEVIRWMVDNQEICFGRLGLPVPSLFERRLHLIDCQNLFCEVDKYARVAHPGIEGLSGRSRIKQKYRQDPTPIVPFFPPKWGLNDEVERFINGHDRANAPATPG